MRWKSKPVLLVIFLSLFTVNISSTPSCPRNAKPFDSNSPIARLGHGFDQFKATDQESGFTSPVIELTASTDYIDLPVSLFRLAVPCESGRGNFGQIAGKPSVSFNELITSFDQYKQVVATKTAFDVGLTHSLVSVGFANIKATVIKEFSSVMFSYRAYQQAQVTIDPLPDQSWWSSDFSRLVDDLDNTSFSHSSYKRLIQTLGTHYVSHAVVGSYIATHASIKYCEASAGESDKGSVFVNGLADDLAILAKAEATKTTQTTSYKLLSEYSVYKAGGNAQKYAQTGLYDDYISSPPPTNNMTVLARQTIFKGLWTLLPPGDPRHPLLKQAVEDYTAVNAVQPTPKDPHCSACGWLPSGKITAVGLLVASIASLIY